MIEAEVTTAVICPADTCCTRRGSPGALGHGKHLQLAPPLGDRQEQRQQERAEQHQPRSRPECQSPRYGAQNEPEGDGEHIQHDDALERESIREGRGDVDRYADREVVVGREASATAAGISTTAPMVAAPG